MGTPAIIAIITVVIVVIGAVYYNTRSEGEIMMDKGQDMVDEGEAMLEEGETMMKDGEAMMEEGESMMKGEDGAMMEESGDTGAMSARGVSYYGEVLAENGNGVYLLNFNQQDYENAIANERLVVLYFYANWCPVCKAEFPLMQQAFTELDTGQDVVGFRVNYNDNQTDDYERGLAKQFGIGYQHTKVFVKNGERILKSPDGWDKARYLTEIKNALKN